MPVRIDTGYFHNNHGDIIITAAFIGCIYQGFAGILRRLVGHNARDLVHRNFIAQAVGTQHENVALEALDFTHIGLHIIGRPHGPRQHVQNTLVYHMGPFGPRFGNFGRNGVHYRYELNSSLMHKINGAIAHIGGNHHAVGTVQGSKGRAHAGAFGARLRPGAHGPVRLTYAPHKMIGIGRQGGITDGNGGRITIAEKPLHRLDNKAACHFPCQMAAHAVGNYVQPAGIVNEECILIAIALFTDISQTSCLDMYHNFPLPL
jgi:hypothetical protein